MKIVYIYCLKCPKGLIRYIGKTVNIKRRLDSHIRESKLLNNKRYVLNWIKSLLLVNQKPTIEIIEQCAENKW